MADDLDDLDEAERGPQPAEGRELVIIDLGHTTMMPRFGGGKGDKQNDPVLRSNRRTPRPRLDRTGRGVRLLPTRGAFD